MRVLERDILSGIRYPIRYPIRGHSLCMLVTKRRFTQGASHDYGVNDRQRGFILLFVFVFLANHVSAESSRRISGRSYEPARQKQTMGLDAPGKNGCTTPR